MKSLLYSIVLGLSTFSIQAETQQQRVEHYNIEKGIAIQGYDPVSYFSNNPKKGNPSLSLLHKGITYQFSSPENLATFKKAPRHYEPQYGGWCAYAFAVGNEKVKINPKYYKIIDGKLYLFYKTTFVNTLKRWNKNDEISQINEANQTWQKIL